MKRTISIVLLLVSLSLVNTAFIQCAKRATQATPERGKLEINKKDLLAMVHKDLKTDKTLTDHARFQEEIIMPGDQISVVLYEKLPISQEKRSELKRVDETGSVFLLPIGFIKLEGLTLAKAEQKVEEKFSELVVSPHCEIQIVKKLYEPRVYVFGEVTTSGSVPYKPGDRLLDALSSAGGCGSYAYKRSIKVIRSDKETVNIYSIDLHEILNSGNIYKNMQLMDNDIIFIPRRFLTTWKEVFGALNVVMPWYVLVRGFMY